MYIELQAVYQVCIPEWDNLSAFRNPEVQAERTQKSRIASATSVADQFHKIYSFLISHSWFLFLIRLRVGDEQNLL
jgi:hypothetical protein